MNFPSQFPISILPQALLTPPEFMCLWLRDFSLFYSSSLCPTSIVYFNLKRYEPDSVSCQGLPYRALPSSPVVIKPWYLASQPPQALRLPDLESPVIQAPGLQQCLCLQGCCCLHCCWKVSSYDLGNPLTLQALLRQYHAWVFSSPPGTVCLLDVPSPSIASCLTWNSHIST